MRLHLNVLLAGLLLIVASAGAQIREDATKETANVRSVNATEFRGLTPDDEFQRARKKTDEVLLRPEFQTVSEEPFIQREIARFWQWVSEMFGGVSRFGQRSPWLVPLMEWSSITLAGAGLLAWVLRTIQRQRLAVRIESNASLQLWQKESAVHCLYWATIVMMEGRKLWRQNRARTPREYLLLLEPGSRMQQTLRRLTQLFERIWYGLRPAGESDYASALVLFEELRGA
jgi:hypothetical protein